MSSTTHGGTPYYFVPGPSRHPAMAAFGLFFVILGAGQWVNGHGWGMYSLFGGLALWGVLTELRDPDTVALRQQFVRMCVYGGLSAVRWVTFSVEEFHRRVTRQV